MRVSYFVLVAAASLLASVDALALGTKQAKIISPHNSIDARPLTANEHGTATRFLRAANKENEDDDDDDSAATSNEERATVNLTPVVDPLIKAAWRVKFFIWKNIRHWDSHRVWTELGIMKGPGMPIDHKNWLQGVAYDKYYGLGPIKYP